MGYASWISHSQNASHTNLQWEEPIILTYNKKRYTVLLHVDTEIDEAKVIINPDYDAIINSTDTVISVPLPINGYYNSLVNRLREYYNIYTIPKRKIVTQFTVDNLFEETV